MGWLRTMAGTNGTSNYRLVCTDNAVALSEYRNERLVVAPFIIDHFVILNEGADISEGQALYDDMNRWGMSIGAMIYRAANLDMIDDRIHIPDKEMNSRCNDKFIQVAVQKNRRFFYPSQRNEFQGSSAADCRQRRVAVRSGSESGSAAARQPVI